MPAKGRGRYIWLVTSDEPKVKEMIIRRLGGGKPFISRKELKKVNPNLVEVGSVELRCGKDHELRWLHKCDQEFADFMQSDKYVGNLVLAFVWYEDGTLEEYRPHVESPSSNSEAAD